MSNKPFNLLLSAFPEHVYEHISSDIEEVNLVQGQTLYRTNEQITYVYFPLETAISLVVTLADSSATEVSMVGYQGMIGLAAILGRNQSPYESIVQIPGKAIMLPAPILRQEFLRSEALRNLVLLYAQAQTKQIAQIAACQTNHLIEQRLARWLLLARDAIKNETLPGTQKLISRMLGVRRASITEAAISLQQAGVIEYSRGQIRILQPQLLESRCCECYQKIKQEYNFLLAVDP